MRWIPIKFSLEVLEKFIFREDRRLFSWGISIVVAVTLAEMVVATMDVLLMGRVTWDYLVTAFVAAILVSAPLNYFGGYVFRPKDSA